MALKALYLHRMEDRKDSWHKAGVVVYSCPNEEANAHATGLEYTVMPGTGDPNPPKCRRTKILYNKLPGQAWIIAYYRVLRSPGSARISYYSIPRRMVRNPGLALLDTQGEIIEGPDPDGVHVWRQTDGADYRSKYLVGVKIQAATLESNAWDDLYRLGKINSDMMPRLGANPETVLFYKFAAKDIPWEGFKLWYRDYTFLIEPSGWNDSFWVKKHIYAAQKTSELTYDGNTTGEFVSKMTLQPWTVQTSTNASGDTVITPNSKTDSPSVNRKPYYTASFADLDCMF